MQLPLAMPVIIAGIRIATVSTIGLVTVTALIGQGGYGVFILRGIRRQFLTEILVGTVLSVLLAVAADLALVALERRITPWARRQGGGVIDFFGEVWPGWATRPTGPVAPGCPTASGSTWRCPAWP